MNTGVQSDEPRNVRDGEELDLARLAAYLRDALDGITGDLELLQFPSGFSNLTYLLRMGDKEWVLRRPPFGSKVRAAHDMGREFRVLTALQGAYPPAPKPLLHCEDADMLGAPFYLMERVRGIILRGKRPRGFHWPPETVRACCESLVQNLADLHALDHEAVGLGALRKEGSFVERQVMGWSERYHASQTDDIPAIDQVVAWLKEHHPADVKSVLIHNDYKFDNIVLEPADPSRIVGVLDWEMTTIGDPLMDLGCALSYWIERTDVPFGMVPSFLTAEPGAMTRAEVAQRYGEITGQDVSNLAFYYTFGLFKLAVIVQQIYYRYKKGLTKDERFAPLIFMVGALGMRAADVIDTGKV
jgi:aminoglycoside phosphotransferase (APT) family kinase protein